MRRGKFSFSADYQPLTPIAEEDPMHDDLDIAVPIPETATALNKTAGESQVASPKSIQDTARNAISPVKNEVTNSAAGTTTQEPQQNTDQASMSSNTLFADQIARVKNLNTSFEQLQLKAASLFSRIDALQAEIDMVRMAQIKSVEHRAMALQIRIEALKMERMLRDDISEEVS
ncbi:hypothetical protein ACJQWK_03327 [Exserohilum turcicum]|uniref:Uncharacterized protein n=1 Tax=Exserohilum turcicum (strain 28A) TaxID=671987 RepID=R0KVV7_EXST2|nr:uncharacterized protein SETTUDRAFT_18560 [Exserohilum turcica Et28A]EOA91897.1 hypothetical protein SETTUDRAFT_18560 [Exserohilum turcica Et28A]